jgi:type IV pilus assembly protein PilW
MIARHIRVKERGFSLIELLVAMAVGLLLTLLVANLFIGSRNTNTTTDEVARMQESIRFAHQLLTRSLRHAGYRSDPAADPALLFTGGNFVIFGTEGGGSVPDTLTVSFQGSGTGTGAAGAADAQVVDCHGSSFDQNITVKNTFSIATGANGAPALFCTSNVSGADVTAEVVPDVENMQILYGEDTDVATRDYMPNAFVPFNQVTTLDNIIAVRVGLLFSTTNAAAATAGGSSSRTDLGPTRYDLNGTTITINPPDMQIRRSVVWNINLRNRSPY